MSEEANKELDRIIDMMGSRYALERLIDMFKKRFAEAIEAMLIHANSLEPDEKIEFLESAYNEISSMKFPGE